MRILIILLLIAGFCYADVVYEATEDPNIIKKVVTTETEINLEELQAEIDLLNEQIETMPEMIEMPSGKEILMWERDEKQDYLNSITVLTAVSK